MSVDRFLDGLPVGLSHTEALAAMAAITRYVGAIEGVGEPSAFADITDTPPASIPTLLDALEAIDASVDLLGRAWEQLLADEARRQQGAHFTPPAVADRLVGLVLESSEAATGTAPCAVWDPAAGGGAFLLAAARALELTGGRTRADIVTGLTATDVDSGALRVCDAALEIWAGGAARPATEHVDALLDLPVDGSREFAVIVGNPPFLGQLTSDTVRSQEMHQRLRERYGSLVGGYVDQAALFVELGLRCLSADGAMGLILPQSFLGARDAEPVRASARQRAHLSALWVDDVGVFEAAVDVIGAVFSAGMAADQTGTTSVMVGNAAPVELATPDPKSWAPLLAGAQGTPVVSKVVGGQRLGELALVTAGFRQHFYGIADAVTESQSTANPRLMTAGVIDPLANLWGERSVKFAGTRWTAPELVLDKIEDAEVRRWFESRLVPKLLIASQTAVLEAVVDPDGQLVPSVPVISVEPHDVGMLWHIAAALTAPTTSAMMLSQTAGTGLSASAMRVSAAKIADLSLPSPSPAWDRGARAAEQAHLSWARKDSDSYAKALTDLAESMIEAYEDDPNVASWWAGRLPKRSTIEASRKGEIDVKRSQ